MDKAKLIELLNVWGETFRSAYTTCPEHVGGKAARGAHEQNMGTVSGEFPPKTLPHDVEVVFESNCAASFDRHLPTFETYEGGG